MDFSVDNKKKEKIRNSISQKCCMAKVEPVLGKVLAYTTIGLAVAISGTLFYHSAIKKAVDQSTFMWGIVGAASLMLILFLAFAVSRLWNIGYNTEHNPIRANETLRFDDGTIFYSYTLFNPGKEEDARVFIVMKLRDIDHVEYDRETEKIKFCGNFFGHYYEHLSNKQPNRAGKIGEFELKDWFNASLMDELKKNNIKIIHAAEAPTVATAA